MVRRRTNRRLRMVILACLLAAAFIFALAKWAGGPPSHRDFAAPPSGISQSGAPSSAPTAHASSTDSSAPPDELSKLLRTGLPGTSITADPGGLPVRSVSMRVTSDKVIAGVGYLVAHGDPPNYEAHWVTSPFTVTTTGRSASLVAFLAAQAAPNASYITCTLIVDGVVKSQRTVHGGYKVTACIG